MKVSIMAINNRIWYLLPLVLSSCFITEVIQPEIVGTQEIFNVSISVVDSLSDPNPWRGTVSVMIPENWEFDSGSYDGDIGNGDMELRTKWNDVVNTIPISKTDSLRMPDLGMKWLDLVTDSAYGYEGPVTNTISIDLKTSADTGRFDLGYIVSKDAFPSARDVLGFWEDGSADSLFNQRIQVFNTTSTNQEDIPAKSTHLELFPNPSRGLLHVRFGENLLSDPKLDIYDVQGRSVLSDIYSTRLSPKSVDLDLGSLARGRYILRIVDDDEVEQRLIILQ